MPVSQQEEVVRVVHRRKPYLVMGTCMRYALKSFYGESMHFGISTAAPARQQVLDFFDSRGLDVENFESLGREAGRSAPIGGLVLAAVPDPSVADRA